MINRAEFCILQDNDPKRKKEWINNYSSSFEYQYLKNVTYIIENWKKFSQKSEFKHHSQHDQY